MAEVTVYGADRMKEIEDASVVNAEIDFDDHLILTRFDGIPIDAGPLPDVIATDFGIIAYQSFEIAGGDVLAPTHASALSDVDGTNLKIPFVVPASGKVLVRLNALVRMKDNSSQMLWGLRDNTTLADVGVTHQLVAYNQGNTVNEKAYRATAEFVVTGLTPGEAKNYRWGHRQTSSSATSAYKTSRGTAGGASVMTVLALP